MVNDEFHQVRAETIRTITQCLANVKTVPISDANIFPEYILPAMVRKYSINNPFTQPAARALTCLSYV